MTVNNFAALETLDRGAQAIYETLAEALLNTPTEQVLDDARSIARTLGITDFDDITTDSTLEQRYYNRMFVASHPCYVALSESMIVPAGIVDGRVEYGAPAQGRRAQVVACYKKAGFNHKALAGFDLAVQSLKADSLASELAFAAFLHHGAAQAASEHDAAQVQTHHRLIRQFIEQHLGTWTEKAARLTAASEDDFYSRLCAFDAQWIQCDLEQLSES